LWLLAEWPWLSRNADRLAEALGIEFEFEDTERAVGGYSLDIIGKDQTNGVVLIIENQLGDSDHGHLGADRRFGSRAADWGRGIATSRRSH
jgi:hypothetical protein